MNWWLLVMIGQTMLVGPTPFTDEAKCKVELAAIEQRVDKAGCKSQAELEHKHP